MPPQSPFAIRWQYPVFQVADDLDPADLKQPQRNAKPTPTPEQVLALYRGDMANPRAALLNATQLRAQFDARRWDRIAAPAVRDSLVAEGKLKSHVGERGAILTGLPTVVEAYEKQLAEEKTILEQTALPVEKPKRNRRHK